jgi:hypothetical protein
MQTHNNTLTEALLNIEKNINDLISQELSLFLLALQIFQNSEKNNQYEKLWLKIYQNITHQIQELLVNLKTENENFLNDFSVEEIKKAVQNSIWQIINTKKEHLEDYIYFIEKNKFTSD